MSSLVNTSPESVLDIKPGDVLAGKYRVERILGSGGMGMVVAAHHLQLDELVALKFLLPTAFGSLEVIGRFMREARTAFKIKSEHIARVTDVGQLENGSPYIVMEYLEGGDLSAWVSQRGPMPIAQAVDFVLQACEALAEAHALGVVHRDLKPANLFCVQRADGALSIKVLDFGISKLTHEATPSRFMTKTSGLVGSPLYMSPEHMKSPKLVDARTDIWSLGVILFELLAGRPPFEAETVTDLVLKVAAEAPFALQSFRPDAPYRLQQVVEECLEKDRDRRFQTIAELAQALLPFGPPHAHVSVDRIAGTLERSHLGSSARISLDQSSRDVIAAYAPAAPHQTPEREQPASDPSVPMPEAGVPLIQGLHRPSQPGMPLTSSAWGQGVAEKPPNGRAIMGIAVGTALGVFALVFALAWPRIRPEPPVQAADLGPSAPSESVPVRADPTPDAEENAAAGAPSASPQPALSTPAPVVGWAPVATAPPTTPTDLPEAAPSHAPRTRPPPAPARTACNPPYYFDAKGTKHYKRECM
jgi:eukaryotic-like serine/threonine-protein kinase